MAVRVGARNSQGHGEGIFSPTEVCATEPGLIMQAVLWVAACKPVLVDKTAWRATGSHTTHFLHGAQVDFAEIVVRLKLLFWWEECAMRCVVQ